MKTYRASASWIALGAAFAACSGEYGEPGQDELGDLGEVSETLVTEFVRVRAVHSDKCVDVQKSSTSDGAVVHQWWCWGGANQDFEFVPAGGDSYRIVARHSGKCLDVTGASTSNGAKVQQWPCTGAANQRWTVTPVTSDAYQIRAVHSGKCLDVTGASTADGALIQQWTCGTGDNQRFRLQSSGIPGTAGRTFYVDPATGSASGDGSATRPWRTLQEVASAGLIGTTVKPGDTVLLRTGYHGEPTLSGNNASPITIAAESGHTPRLRRVLFRGATNLVLRGVSISPSHATTYARVNIVDIDSASADLVIENSTLFSINDASAWTATDWVDRASSGFQVNGARITVRNNTIRNVRFGISVSGESGRIQRNQVVNFSADGLRGLGNNGLFEYNTVKNCYAPGSVDSNHDDGFQSWSVGPGGVGTGEVRGVVLRGNTFINFENPNQPLRADMQAIGCFDGFFVNWVVENNVVVTNHWHGITFLGMKDSRIVNNTVIDNVSGQPGPPWIMVNPHKNGQVSQNVTIRNNLSTAYDLKGTNIVQDHNVTLTSSSLATYFVNPAAFDLHLRAGSPAIDTGSSSLAPALDHDQVSRPQGAQFDIGAYEFR